jgi:hypothetical protein
VTVLAEGTEQERESTSSAAPSASASAAAAVVYRLALFPWIRPTLVAGFCS